MANTRGLTQVVDADLKRLLKALHHGHLPSPISRSGLIAAAFGHVEEHLDAVVGLDTRGAQSLVSAVLAERQLQRSGGAVLAVSGPAVAGTLSDDTLGRVRELVARAEKSVLLLGVSADTDAGLVRTLEAIAQPRAVEVTLVGARPGALDALKERPETWHLYAPRQLVVESRAVVVDRERVLIVHDDLSGHEDEGRLRLGVLVEDATFASSLLDELERLTRSGHFVKAS